MKKIMLFNIFVVLLLALASVNVRAVSLAGLVDQNGSFIDSGLIFSGWTVNQIASDNAFLVDSANVQVSGVTTSSGARLSFSVLNNGMSVVGDGGYGYLDYSVSFWVTVLNPSHTIFAMTSDLITFTSSDVIYSGVAIQTTAIDYLGSSVVATAVGINYLNTVVSSSLNDYVLFSPQPDLFVTENIFLWASSLGQNVILDSFDNQFSIDQKPVPVAEPFVLLFLGLFILGIALVKPGAYFSR